MTKSKSEIKRNDGDLIDIRKFCVMEACAVSKALLSHDAHQGGVPIFILSLSEKLEAYILGEEDDAP